MKNILKKPIIFALLLATIVLSVFSFLIKRRGIELEEKIPQETNADEILDSSPTFNISFDTQIKAFKNQELVYSATSIANDQNFINSLVNILGLNEKDIIETLNNNNLVWINDTKTLQIDKTSSTISYSNDVSQNQGFVEEKTKSLISEIANNIFTKNNINIKLTELKFYQLERYELIETTPEKATQAVATYTQEVNNLPIISSGFNQQPISISINNNGDVFSLNIFGGFSNIESKAKYSTTNIDNIINNHNELISYFINNQTVSTSTLFSMQKNINLNINSSEKCYFQSKESNYIYPGYFLSGKLPYNKNVINVRLFVPILDPSSYK